MRLLPDEGRLDGNHDKQSDCCEDACTYDRYDLERLLDESRFCWSGDAAASTRFEPALICLLVQSGRDVMPGVGLAWLFWYHATRNTPGATAILRLIAVVVAAFVDHQRAAANIGYLELIYFDRLRD